MNDDVTMNPHFYGFKEVTVDTKGRVVIPKIFHSGLSGASENESSIAGIRLSISMDVNQQCAVIVTEQRWEHQFTALTTDDSVNLDVRRIKLGTHEWVEVGDNGRILIPKTLRKMAGVEREGLVTGAGTKLELWDKSLFYEYYARVRENAREQIGNVTRKSVRETIDELEL